MARHWYDLSVFTRDGEGGNPLAVVPDAVGVDTASRIRLHGTVKLMGVQHLS